MTLTDPRKQSLYLEREMLAELRREADRLGRSLSWCVQWAIKHDGLKSLKRIPSLDEVSG